MRIDTELQVGYVRLVAIEDPDLFVEVEIDLEGEGGDSVGGPALGLLCSECAAELEAWAEGVTATYTPPPPVGWRIDDAPGLAQ